MPPFLLLPSSATMLNFPDACKGGSMLSLYEFLHQQNYLCLCDDAVSIFLVATNRHFEPF
jgi:hypothetical protein